MEEKDNRGDLGKKADFTLSLNSASRTRRSRLRLLDPKIARLQLSNEEKGNSAQCEILP
jgi:hypothetical protein